MKKIFNLALLLFIGILSSCDDRLDIVPKGQTTLNNLKDIELLLNQNIRLEGRPLSMDGTAHRRMLSCGNPGVGNAFQPQFRIIRLSDL